MLFYRQVYHLIKTLQPENLVCCPWLRPPPDFIFMETWGNVSFGNGAPMYNENCCFFPQRWNQIKIYITYRISTKACGFNYYVENPFISWLLKKNIFIVQIACSKISSGLKTIYLIKLCNLFQKWWLHQQVKVSTKKNLITGDRKFVNFSVWWPQVRQISTEIYHLSIEKN